MACDVPVREISFFCVFVNPKSAVPEIYVKTKRREDEIYLIVFYKVYIGIVMGE